MKYSLTLSIILLAASHIYAQTDVKVSAIRKKVEQINNDTGYVKKILTNEQFLDHMTDGGGSLVGFYKDGTLVKMDLWVGLSSCIDIYEYYLENGQLIFVYGQERDSKIVGKEDSLLSRATSGFQNIIMECRYYFENQKLIKTDFKGETRCNAQPSENDAKKLLMEGFRYAIILKNKP